MSAKNWIDEHKNIGILKVGQRKTVIFNSTKDLEIKELTSSCSCSTPNYNKKTKELIVAFTPKSVPKHLAHQKWYKTTKMVTVTYVDGKKDILSFEATIKE